MAKTFGAKSTTDDVLEGVDITGKRVLVTGVSAGLGVETARTLAAHGASVIGTARNLEKARSATAHIPGIELIEMDLASLKSVRAAADKLNADGQKFDLVIANAGVMAIPTRTLTEDGFETQFGTNHLGHFVFINRIAPLFAPGSRLVNLSSSGHRYSDVNLDDPNFERTEYTDFGAYGRSKTANVLFAVEFDRRHQARGVRATAVHPGGIETELARHMAPGALQSIVTQLNVQAQARGEPAFELKTIPQGAATSVWAGVVAPAEDVAARFCEDCHVADVTDAGDEVRSGVRSYALDGEHAKALWTKSEEIVGERF
ncbi:SDR family NAD(P)-dependent oxidoreductase [Terricaulis silvestris]|uniref:Probable oxidoreductase n=1 Tax=Terricaulis silvestris TaxID=2686094 RepID=A0A6I6MGG5_9CAUL|nr:SDR family NAD(P)-dependent oxidoreductase [Terricaulis silvestris]QGZ93755.1 2,3-dihydro-2,3-dihydroxybenzoate dehydrogenase [Terricaulis silvestris]